MIKTTVNMLIKKHKTNNPFRIAKSKNIEILFMDLGKTYGYYRAYKRIQTIHLNNRLDERTQYFVCAHELGHAILHPRANTSFLKHNTFFSLDKIEVEANKFAVELLMPDKEVYEYESTNLSIYEIGEIYGIPKEMAELKKLN